MGIQHCCSAPLNAAASTKSRRWGLRQARRLVDHSTQTERTKALETDENDASPMALGSELRSIWCTVLTHLALLCLRYPRIAASFTPWSTKITVKVARDLY